jgi:tricorn protease-like protein
VPTEEEFFPSEEEDRKQAFYTWLKSRRTLIVSVACAAFVLLLAGTVIRMLPDTAEKIVSGRFAAFDGKRVYYSNFGDNGSLYSMDPDGGNPTKLNDDVPMLIHVAGDRLYYVNANEGLTICSVRTDGGDRRKLNDNMARELSVAGGRIYYCNDSDDGSIYSMDLDGGDRKKLNDDYSELLHVAGGKIIYRSVRDFAYIMMDLDGANRGYIGPLVDMFWGDDWIGTTGMY